MSGGILLQHGGTVFSKHRALERIFFQADGFDWKVRELVNLRLCKFEKHLKELWMLWVLSTKVTRVLATMVSELRGESVKTLATFGALSLYS